MGNERLRAASRVALAALMLALTGAPTLAQEASGSRLTGLRLSGDEPIQIESDRLEIRDAERVAVFSGNVTVVQGPTLMRTARMTVRYSTGGGPISGGGAAIEKLEADGKVYVKSEEQVATGDRGTFDMRTETLVLTGEKVVLSEGDNVIVGCRLTVEMKSGEARFDGCGEASRGGGRIIMQITPRDRND
jgi:lipopolysaccharide export system protein LptA